MNQLMTEKAPCVAGRKNPDVIVARADQTALFKPQNCKASEWLRKHYHLATANGKSDAEMHVHPTRCKRIIEELKAAGFLVIDEKEE